MAEGALFILASKILYEIRSQAFQKAYEQDHSIWGAKQDLEKLCKSIETFQPVLLDAEKKQGDSAAIKAWMERLRDVLYEADDLLDRAATDALLTQKMKETKLLKKVRASLPRRSSNNNIAKEVKAVRKSLDNLCNDMAPFQFTSSPWKNQLSVSYQRQREVAPSFVDKEGVIGRDGDKEAILKFLYDESNPGQSIPIIAVVGIGCIGKTTLARLIYRDEEVKKNFEKRWWAAISDINDEKEILGRIFTSISRNESYHGVTISKLYSAIMDSMNSTGKYLLVLDGVRDCTSSIWLNVMSLLRSGTIGSRIIITTRSLKVAEVMGADEIHQLEGLTEEESWKLFDMIAFQPGQTYTPDQRSLGREIVGRCNGVPLAIKSMASLLSTKHTIEEWHIFNDEKILFDGSVESTLRLSYNQLPSTLKQCLAYCSLFPKDYVFWKKELIYLWIGQGFVMPMPDSDGRTFEEMGYEYFKELLERLFFQEATIDECGEVLNCKMNGAIHDLVQSVAGDDSIIITKQFQQNHMTVRHLSVGYEIDSSWNIPQALFHVVRPPLRSFLFLYDGSLNPLVLDELLTKFKLLRALNLGHQNIEEVPSSIGDLKHLRYLNLSNNKFVYLPDSIITLVNLLTLDISWCEQLELLPDGFRKLCNLRHLDTRKCYRLRYMPPGFEELTCLQCLSFFKVGKVMDARDSKLNVLAKLELKGELEIRFDKDMDWDENECLQLPNAIRVLTLENYPGKKLPYWETAAPSLLPNLVSLHIGPSSKIEHLSLFRGLTSLQNLQLSYLEQLEYMETEKDEIEGGQSASIFPCLKVLKLEGLPKLKGWSREVEATVTSLPVLADLTVRCCPELKFMPLCPRLQTLELNDVNQNLIQHLLSTSFDASSSSDPLSSLETIAIWGCDLPSFPGGHLTSLRQLQVRFCDELKYLNLAPPELNTLEELVIQSCPELELWEEEKRGVDWDSLPKLCKLTVISMPGEDKFPICLQQRQEQGNLLINIK